MTDQKEYVLQDHAWVYINPHGNRVLLTGMNKYMPKCFVKQIAWFKPGTKMKRLHGDNYLIQNMKVWVDPKHTNEVKEL